ncbi:MAG: hypothetical protein V4717_01385 [Bacteroidota bacterium]
MDYIKTVSKHDKNLIMYMEVDENFIELKKIELVENDLLGYASQDVEFNGTSLASTPLLSISEINAIENISAVKISREEFYSLWDRVILTDNHYYDPQS